MVISANHNNEDNLAGHLLNGLSPKGVPKTKKYCFSFNYIDYDELLRIVEENNIGVIKMEVIRNFDLKMIFK